MAQSNLKWPIFKTATGGLSDDIFTGIDGSFFASKNINIRDNARSILLNKALVKDSWTVITEKINAIIKTSTGKYMAVWSSWGLYWKNTTNWAKITSDSPATEVYSLAEFSGYIYWTTNSYIHRLAVGNLSSNITATDVINRHSLASSTYYPLLVSQGDMYVGHWGRVDKVNNLDVWEGLLTMDSSNTVKDLDDLGWSIRVVTSSNTGNSNIYLWDWVSDAPDQTIPLIWYDVRHSIIFNGYNYLITNKWLWILDWYKVFPLKKIDVFNDNLGSIDVFNEKLYVGWTGWVYVFGQKSKDYPEVLNKAYSTSNGSDTDVINAIYSDWTDLYVAWSNGTSYGIDKLSTTVYYTSGYLETKGYIANSLAEIKETVSAMIWFKPLFTGETISLYYSVDGWAYTKIIDITSASVLPDLFTEDLLFSSGSFQYIQFKIEFVWPWTSTPEFYSFDLVFNNNLKR